MRTNITASKVEIEKSKVVQIISILLLAFSIFVVWLVPRTIGDLFVALASGRDTLKGMLNTPDSWSFTTNNTVWINQNWGTGVLFYLTYKWLGQTGLMELKYLMISACAIFLILFSYKRKVPIVISMLVISCELLAISPFVDLRPNLISLVFISLLLWLIYLAIETPKIIWFSVGAIIVWANMHGGFIYGVAILFYLAVCLFVFPWIINNKMPEKNNWHYPIAAICSLIFSGIITPLGIINVTHPFLIANSKEWRTTNEWLPIWDTQSSYGNPKYFIIIISITILLILVKLFNTSNINKKKKTKNKLLLSSDMQVKFFEIGLIIVTVIMASISRRFIPLALFVNTAFLSLLIWNTIKLINLKFMMIALISIVTIISGYSFYFVGLNYFDNKGKLLPGGLFNIMHCIDYSFPVGIAKLINENKLTGNMMCDWKWEGFFRWNCENIKLYIGGRAQQIYDIKTYRNFGYFLSGQKSIDEITYGDKVNFIAFQRTSNNNSIIDSITSRSKRTWIKVYDDGMYFLLADSNYLESIKLAL